MKLKEFLKPTLGKILVFIILLVLAYVSLGLINPKLFPCYVKPHFPGSEYGPEICEFCLLNLPPPLVVIPMIFGVCPLYEASAIHTFSSIILFIVFLGIIPHLISCFILSLIKKK